MSDILVGGGTPCCYCGLGYGGHTPDCPAVLPKEETMSNKERAAALAGDMPWVTEHLSDAQIADLAKQIEASMNAVAREISIGLAEKFRQTANQEIDEFIEGVKRILDK